MGHINASTVVRQFKRTFDEVSLNELGKATRLCRREREATPYRLMLTLIEAFASGKLDSIADIHRAFNALCDKRVQYKPFHNQLSKAGFPVFVRLMLSRLLNELACDVLRFSPHSPFARFEHIRIQDGTSFAVKPGLANTFSGRFTTISPAAVELHADLDLMSEMLNTVTLSADSEGERQFLPEPSQVSGGLQLADRGYLSLDYMRGVDAAGGHFIIRGKADMNPLILKAIGPDGREIDAFSNLSLKAVKPRLSTYDCVDMTVRFGTGVNAFECRLVVHPNLREDDTPRYLVTNLERQAFTTDHVSDGYRLRWQVELLFKEWKSHSNLHAFDTANPNIAEGLIWASLCAATVKRYCAHMTQRITRIAISTRIVAKCIRHVLSDVLFALMHRPRSVQQSVERTIQFLSVNARRAHPKRDKITGRAKLGLHPVYADAGA
jgi:hypothetical protein